MKYKPGTLLRYESNTNIVYIEYIIILSYFTKNKEEYVTYYTVSNYGLISIKNNLSFSFSGQSSNFKVLHEI